MKIIALTGGMGAGKTTVLEAFECLGAKTLDCDSISHTQMMPGGCAYNKVVEEFGDKILNSNNEIDRKALADIVFSDEKLLKNLEFITHNCIFDELKAQISNITEDVVVIEVPLLFKCEFPFNYDASVAVIADTDVRIKRIIKRDNCTAEDALKRIKKQLSNDELIMRADFVIENNGDITLLKTRTEEVYNRICRSADN